MCFPRCVCPLQCLSHAQDPSIHQLHSQKQSVFGVLYAVAECDSPPHTMLGVLYAVAECDSPPHTILGVLAGDDPARYVSSALASDGFYFCPSLSSVSFTASRS